MQNDKLKAPKLFFDDCDFSLQCSSDIMPDFQRSNEHEERFSAKNKNLQKNENLRKLKEN